MRRVKLSRPVVLTVLAVVAVALLGALVANAGSIINELDEVRTTLGLPV